MGRSRLKMEGVGPIRLPSSKDDVVPVCSQNSSEALADVSSRPQTNPAHPRQLFKDVHPSSGVFAGSDKPSLNTLCPALPRLAVSWCILGMSLGAKDHTLKLIEQNHKGDQEKCCTEMLQNWSNGKQDCGDCPRTWDDLLPVVQSAVGTEAIEFIRREILKWEEDVQLMEEGTTENYKAIMYAAPDTDVEIKDRRSLLSVMKNAAKSKKLDPCMLIKALYVNTFVLVADILERNEQHSRKMVRAARTAIQNELAKGDAEGLILTLTVTELLEKLCISKSWDDTCLLKWMVNFLPEGSSTLALSLLERYDLYLDVYREAVRLNDSLKQDADAPEVVAEPEVQVEVTLAKDLSEFTCKDCKEMLFLLLCKAFKIPQSKIKVTEARSGDSTTVVCLINKAFLQNIVRYLIEASAFWAFQELGITRIRVPSLLEVNVLQLLSQSFKEALRSGLTSDMDFVGATKVLPYELYVLVDLNRAEQLCARIVCRKIARPWTEQEELVFDSADDKVEPTPEDKVEPTLETVSHSPDDTAISLATGGTSCDEQLSMVPELKETIKDLEQKTANLFMDNVSLSTKLKAIRKAETEQQDEIRNLEERLLQALKAQEATAQELSQVMNEKSHLEGKLKVLEATEPVLEMDSDLEEITKEQDWQKPWDVQQEKADGRGIARGGCTLQGCNCSQYQPQRKLKCACGHPPAKHAWLTEQNSGKLQKGGGDVTLDLDLEQHLSPDDHQPTSVPSITNVSSVKAPFVTQAWTGPSQSLTAGPMLTAASGPALHDHKCAIPECSSPRYVDPSDHVHECCGFNHAMELQRRQAIQSALVVKGVTHCLLPWCNSIVWPFMNYCCKSHADYGISWGLQPPAAQPAAGAQGPSAPLLQDKDDTMCLLPQCRRKKYREPDGTVHSFCGRTHAELTKNMNITDQNILTKRDEVDAFLKQFSGVLRVVNLVENPSAKPGGQLFERFQTTWRGLNPSQRKTILAFHGTPEANIQSICTNGFDPSRRRNQAYGPGEYFVKTPSVPMGYCQGGKKMLLCELLLGQVNIHHTTHGDIVVMKDPAHNLPRFVIEFA